MNKKNEDFVIKVLSFVKKMKEKGKTLGYISKKVKCQIDTMSKLNVRQKHGLYVRIMKWARSTGYADLQEIIKYVNQLERKIDVKDKVKKLGNDMGTARKSGTEHGTPRVFYLCSYHNDPGKDHAEWQGRLYVDRFWKSVMSEARSTDRDMYGVRSYIKNHQILTVQEVVLRKPYLITRPYCRHKMIPLSTDEVLGSSLNKIKSMHPEAHTKHMRKRKNSYKQRRRIEKALG